MTLTSTLAASTPNLSAFSKTWTSHPLLFSFPNKYAAVNPASPDPIYTQISHNARGRPRTTAILSTISSPVFISLLPSISFIPDTPSLTLFRRIIKKLGPFSVPPNDINYLSNGRKLAPSVPHFIQSLNFNLSKRSIRISLLLAKLSPSRSKNSTKALRGSCDWEYQGGVETSHLDAINLKEGTYRTGTAMHVEIAVCVLLGTVAVIVFLRRGTGESYSLDHAILNTPMPTTLWMNMGYWKVYPVMFPGLIMRIQSPFQRHVPRYSDSSSHELTLSPI